MLVRGGSKISDPNVRLLVVTPLTTNSDCFFTIAGRIEGERTDAANGPRREPRLRRRDRSGHEQTEICEVAAVERNLLHGLCRDDMADRGGRSIDERHFGANEHRLGHVANRQVKVTHQRAADVDVQRFDALGAKSVRLGRDRVCTIGNREDVVPRLGIGANGHIEADRLVLHADDGAGNEGAGRIEARAPAVPQGSAR